MQTIILAAGKGTRLGELTMSLPKPMVELNGTSLIKRALDSLTGLNISCIHIVVGHFGKKLMQHIGNNYNNVELKYIENPDFDTKNNIYSLWLCRHILAQDDTLILDGDVIFDHNSISSMNNNGDNVIMTGQYENWMNGTVIEFSKDNFPCITKSNCSSNLADRFKTVNIYKFSKEFSKDVYLPLVDKELKNEDFHLYYEDVISTEILKKYFKIYKTKDDEKWHEVDNPADLASASLLFPPEKNTYKTLVKSFGGHWRVPQIKDFYYLNNPFFPNKEILDDMKRVFNQLIINYPSGRTLVDQLSSVVFKIKKEHILVANGASEIITCLQKTLKGKFGVFLPTFDEYINRLEPSNLLICELNKDDFKLGIDEIKKIALSVQNVVIINPNNPTGNIIGKKELMIVLDYLKEKNKNLIVDESFADFCSEDISLIDPSIIAKYDNLYIIKSLGKSYGIPGIRIGTFLTSNTRILNAIREELPIWNINSIGEYFLEIFPRYEKSFLGACLKVQKERAFVIKQLLKIHSLKVFNSYGNFILCRLSPNYDSQEFVIWMYNKHGIFLKDCSEKRGLEESQYLRIGIKNRKDNELLVRAFKEYFMAIKRN